MMIQRTSSKNIQVGNRGILLSQGGATVVNPLASVPWVAQWKFNNNGNDSIGANNLTNNNSATFTTGLLGGATGATQLVLASSQYWSITDNAAMSMGQIDFFFAAWVYLDSKPAAGTMAIISRYNTGTFEYALLYQTTPDRFNFRILNAAGSVEPVVTANTFGSPSLATWYHVMAWRDMTARTINICVNNGAVDSLAETCTVSDTACATLIGAGSAGAAFKWNGRVDNLCIAKSAAGGGGVLSAAQRTAFYNGGAGTEGLT